MDLDQVRVSYEKVGTWKSLSAQLEAGRQQGNGVSG